MAKLTAGQIKGLAQDAGFNASDSVVMTAIALAESGGDPTSHNGIPPDDSYGLWQINMFGSLGPARMKQFHLTSATQLFDPRINAVAAHAIWATSGFRAWSTYTSGAYKLYMAKAKADAAQSQATQGVGDDLTIGGEIVGGIVGGPLGAAGAGILGNSDIGSSATGIVDAGINLANDAAKTAVWISNPSNWLRILYVAGGAAAILIAAQSLFKPVTDAAIKGAVKTVSNAIPEAKAVTKSASIAKTASHSAPSAPKITSASTPASKPVPRSAKSASHARSLRQSGYEGPIRHDY